MSTKDCNADKSRERTDAQATDDDDCCLGEFPCFEHYEVEGDLGPFTVPESDLSVEEALASVDVDTSGELSRIDPLPDDVEA